MCGLAGFLSPESFDSTEAQVRAAAMSARILHRGPDDSGVWADPEAGLALGHVRLSILDLSPAGHQPMRSDSGRFVIVFNGEIYNHRDLRADLAQAGAAPAWRGQSDTETLLAAFEFWGVEKTLARTVGMFAIALWDRSERVLYLARDRFGEKPLYYGWVQDTFVFGSELKALRAYPGFDNPVNPEALRQYLQFCHVPAPHSIYDGVFKLPPGCLLIARPRENRVSQSAVAVTSWWSLADLVTRAQSEIFSDEAEALSALESALDAAVRSQMLADVPLGAFLSGGVDSSAVVALMQKASSHPVRTFTVGFEESGFDESAHARAIARHLGTDHVEMIVTAREAREVIPDLPDMFDEPFADSSQIPTHLVCSAARQVVTVALSGDGGDELFGGYNRYLWGPRLWRRLGALPHGARDAVGRCLATVPPDFIDALATPLAAILGRGRGVVRLGEKVAKLSSSLVGARSIDDLYANLVTTWRDATSIVKPTGLMMPSRSAPGLPAHAISSSESRMMFLDAIRYLPDDILCKVDRAAMAVSLETRVPFLDHRVAELAWRLPMGMKIRNGEGKWALRQVLYQYVPRELIERPKAGFGVPIGQWLRGPLRDWAESLLGQDRLVAEGFFHPAPIRACWRAHLAGRRDHTAALWAVLMFQSWLAAQGTKVGH